MTQRLYYSDPHTREFEATVVSCRACGDKFEITLDRTAFYPEGGGQPGDTGRIGVVAVTDTRERDGEIIHIASGSAAEGDAVRCEIDWARRFDFMQQHSGEHILSGILNRRFGCENVGFHIGADVVTIDFAPAITEAELSEAEAEANSFIRQNVNVETFFTSEAELCDIPYRSKKELSGEVRIVRFPGADTCACCGTHVKSSGEIGLIKTLSIKKFRDGVRIELVCGERAYKHVCSVCEQNRAVSCMLSAKIYETAAAVSRLLEENAALKRRFYEAEEQMIADRVEKFRGKGDALLFEDGLDPNAVRRLCDAVAGVCGGRCAVFSGGGDMYRYAVISGDDGDFVRRMNASLGGRGGGRDGLAQGSVSASKEAIVEFFKANV